MPRSSSLSLSLAALARISLRRVLLSSSVVNWKWNSNDTETSTSKYYLRLNTGKHADDLVATQVFDENVVYIT